MQSIFNKALPHLIVSLIFLVITCIYYAPTFSGKKLFQNDVIQASGWLKEANDYQKQSNEEILWSNSMFSGMPVWRGYSNNVVKYYHKIITTILTPNIAATFTAFIGFYLLMMSIDSNHWVGFISSGAFAFSSFNIISIEAGHMNKVFDMALMAPVLAGIIWAYRGYFLKGGLVTAIALALHIFYAHYQITYYLLMMVFTIVLYFFIESIKNKSFLKFTKSSGILLIASLIAIAPNISSLVTTQIYSKSTQRAGSELSSNEKNTEKKGLNKDYTFAWSYGKLETLTLLIPYFNGGSSSEELNTNSDTYKALIDSNVPKNEAKNFIKNIPLYWGEQPFTSGPVYFGIIILFTSIIGMFLIERNYKWWIFGISMFSFLLAWGKNLDMFSDLLYYNFPLYNKFRSVTMSFCIAQISVPFLSGIAINGILSNKFSNAKIKTALKWALILVMGTLFILLLFSSSILSFESANDEQFKQQFPTWLIEAIQSDRYNKLFNDILRGLILVALSAASIWAWLNNYIKTNIVLIAIAFLVLIDIILVDKRYLNFGSFKNPKTTEFASNEPTDVDLEILKDSLSSYRVANFTKNIFNDATTSYFHHSIGGYSAIKLNRYQDLIDKQLSKNNIQVYNMLNTKYFIVPDKGNGSPKLQINQEALGNAWMVEKLYICNSANKEMSMLDSLNLSNNAVVSNKFKNLVNQLVFSKDSLAEIKLINYHPNRLNYKFNANSNQAVVFSEIYYQPGWQAYIDGKQVEHFQINYVLRGLIVPKGNHEIEFKFEPSHYFTTEKISLLGSIILVMCILGYFVYYLSFSIKKSNIKNSQII
jgi:hypothetical protein